MNMKRTITHIFAAAAVVLSFASCWNEEIDDIAKDKYRDVWVIQVSEDARE